MINYELGKTYQLDVLGIEKVGNNDYIHVVDADGVHYKLFDIFPCQYEDLPEKVTVYITAIDKLGKPKMRQDLASFNREHYMIGNYKAFQVTELKMDKNGYTYYEIEDGLSCHNFYYTGAPKYSAGDDIILMVSGINKRGYLEFIEHDAPMQSVQTKPAAHTVNRNCTILDLGEEGTELELKTSIVFPPNCNGVPDIGKQVRTILEELVSFMNARGGKLYIGVHDQTHAVTGIEGDYPYLDSDPDDALTYKPRRDGFELKIRNAMERYSQTLANSLMEFEFKEADGHDYCIIDVKPAKRPIWLFNSCLFQRLGNGKRMLKGDAITNFVFERMTVSIRDMIEDKDALTGMDPEMMKEMMREVLKEQKPVIKVPKVKDVAGETDYWIVWKNDATWTRQREKSEDPNVRIQLPVMKGDKDAVVVFCYKEGSVNLMKLSDFKRGANLGMEMKDGFCTNQDVTLSQIFIAHPSNYLVGFSVDPHGIQYVKAHSLVDFRASRAAKNKGARFVPSTSVVSVFKILDSAMSAKASHLIRKSNETSQVNGTPLDSDIYADEIRFVSEIE